MTPGQELERYEMQSTEDDRAAWEWFAAVLAVTVAVAWPLVLRLGPLFY